MVQTFCINFNFVVCLNKNVINYFIYVLTILCLIFCTVKCFNHKVKYNSERALKELVLKYNSLRPQPSYHLEDFFWTGSGDGSIEESNEVSVKSTVFITSTVTSTLLIPITQTIDYGTSNDTTTQTASSSATEQVACVYNCNGPSTPAGTINPTPTVREWDNVSYSASDEVTRPTTHKTTSITSKTSVHRYQTPDRRYWILTILESKIHVNDADDATEEDNVVEELPQLEEMETRLATLYQIAFYRQQQRHLGIQNYTRTKRSTVKPHIKKPVPPVVHIQIHNLTKNFENNELELIYSVRVAEQLVPAKTAAADMRLVSDTEMVNELGYNVRTKAEPYLKEESKPLGLARIENTWIFVGTGIAALFLLLFLLMILVISIRKKTSKKLTESPPPSTAHVVAPVFNRGEKTGNLQFKTEDAEVQTCGGRITNFPPTSATTTIVEPKHQRNSAPHHPSLISSSESENSTSTTSSSESSPTLNYVSRQWKEETKHKSDLQRTIIEKTSHLRQQVEDYGYKEVVDATNIVTVHKAGSNGIQSAHSYLSMPSVRNFPRGSIPEPLSRVLEPVSIRHLDDGIITPIESPMKTPKQSSLTRHGSMQEAEDPGVIGPLVWNQHCQRLQQVEKETITEQPPNVGRMKKRFQELLDDAFSLFGSRSVSPEETTTTNQQSPRTIKKIDSRAHSAYPRLASDTESPKIPPMQPRPKTSDPRKSVHATGGIDAPRHAWGSGTPSPLVRPISAGPFLHRPTLAPHICPIRILPEARLDPNDPAVPVIAAIKDELRKCTEITAKNAKK